MEMGAELGVSYGWDMAQSYSDPSKEHVGVRANAGLVDLSYQGAIEISGSEGVQFLNGLVTNDVKTLKPGKGMRAAFLTGHGKVRAICRILNLGKVFLVINDPQTHDKVFKYVHPFSFAGDFKVDDASGQYRSLSIQGPKAELIMREICFEPVPALAEHDWFETQVGGHRALVVRASHTGELGFDILVSVAALKDVWDFILLKGRFHSIVPFGLKALDSLRIEAGIPVFGVDVDETNMMLETALEDAVSFTKGCYTGQEAVAMATYRGHVSKRLSGLMIEGDGVAKGGDIVRKGEKEIGLITSCVRSVTLESTIALAYLKFGFFEPGNAVEISSDCGVLSAVVAQLPFHRAA
jgi:folate-binding protein YgfZ